MATIDGDWIKTRLANRYGEKARLAAHAGLEPKQLSYILNGTRKVSQAEAIKIAEYFNEAGVSAGGSENGVEPLDDNHGVDANALARAAGVDRENVNLYRARRNYPGFSIKRGDLLIVDPSSGAEEHRLTIVTTADSQTGTPITTIRRFVPPWLLSESMDDLPIRLQSNSEVQRLSGTVVGVLRNAISDEGEQGGDE